VSVPSLERYRRSITEFVNQLPQSVERIGIGERR